MPHFKFLYDPTKPEITYTYKESNKLVDLRKRIIRIAASYVGQVNQRKQFGVYPPSHLTKAGKPKLWPFSFDDPEFQKKMENIGWFPSSATSGPMEWCNYFCRLVYAEAFYGGNAIPSLSGPSGYTDVNNFTKNSSGKYKISLNGQNSTSYERPNYGALDPTVRKTRKNFADNLTVGNRFIDLAGDQSAPCKLVYSQNGNSIVGGMNNRKKLLKKFIEVKAVLPGDMIIFDWSKDLTADHIGIYLGGSDGFMTIDGNFSNKVNHRSPGITSIRGICQLSTVNNP